MSIHSWAVIAVTPVKYSQGNFITESISVLGDAFDQTNIISNVEYVSKNPKEKIVNSFEGTEGFGVYALKVYARKFFFFKKKLLTLLVNVEMGTYQIIDTVTPQGEIVDPVNFKVHFENPNRRPR